MSAPRLEEEEVPEGGGGAVAEPGGGLAEGGVVGHGAISIEKIYQPFILFD